MRQRSKEPRVMTAELLAALLADVFVLVEGVVRFLTQASQGPRTCILGEAEISILLQFFVLLDKWDQ